MQDHGQEVCTEVPQSLIDETKTDLVDRKLVPKGAVVKSITKEQLDSVKTETDLTAFGEMLAGRGFAKRTDTGGIAILVANKASGEIARAQRLNKDKVLAGEYNDPSKWGRLVRYGPALGVPAPNHQKMIDAAAAVHRKDGKQGA